MDEVWVNDKQFRISISAEEIGRRVVSLAEEISREYEGRDPILISVLNGAFIFTADLMRALDFDPPVHFTRLSSYGDAMTSGGKIREMVGLEIELEGKDILIVEDIVDQGHTVSWLREKIGKGNPRSVKVAALLYKPEAFQGGLAPEFVGFEIPNDFVVGYGLDFAQRGRGLKGIYKVVE